MRFKINGKNMLDVGSMKSNGRKVRVVESKNCFKGYFPILVIRLLILYLKRHFEYIYERKEIYAIPYVRKSIDGGHLFQCERSSRRRKNIEEEEMRKVLRLSFDDLKYANIVPRIYMGKYCNIGNLCNSPYPQRFSIITCNVVVNDACEVK